MSVELNGILAKYEEGKLVTSNTSQSTKTDSTDSTEKTKGSGNTLDKDAFLQLLVAQMKYQDPMEPTSNTEYISQYATFSELEQMQNMSSNLSLSRASTLVGKEVVIESTGENGKVTTVQGQVQYVTYQSGKAFLTVDGALYPMDDLRQVIDDEYLEGADIATQIAIKLAKLPKIENVTLADATDVVAAYDLYSNMTDYQKTLLDKEVVQSIDAYVSKITELLKEAEVNNKTEEDGIDNKDGESSGDDEVDTDNKEG